MRSLPPDIIQKFNQTIQTRDNDSSFHNYIWIKRPTTELIDGQFVEGPVNLTDASGASDFDIAVCHPFKDHDDTSLWECYIVNGQLKISEYLLKDKIDNTLSRVEHLDPIGYSSTPVSCAIAFDGTMPKNDAGFIQFVSQQYPWIFCAYSDGKLMAKQLYTNRIIDVLAERNCTDVTAIRAMSSTNGGFDFGLVCFFILNGTIYYRQFINGEWMDAELVSKLPNATWVEIAAFRTWDYRIGIHAKNSSGEVYELFTQYMGIGKLNTEHISVGLNPEETLTRIHYTSLNDKTHIEANIQPDTFFEYAWSAIPVSAENVEYNGIWSTRIKVTFDHKQHNYSIDLNSCFVLSDSNGSEYACIGGELSDDGMELYLDFIDFNYSWNAEIMSVTYTAPPTNGMQSPVVPTDSFSIDFVATNLIKPEIDPPEVVRMWNE